MRTTALKMAGLFLVLVSTSAFSYDHSLYRTSLKLEQAANHLVRLMQSRTGESHLTRKARRLANSVSHFRYSVANGYGRHHLRRDFRAIKWKYFRLMRSFRYAHHVHHSRYVQHDVNHVRRHFHELRYKMNRYGQRYRYSYRNHHLPGYW